jgi:hypothetical protein
MTTAGWIFMVSSICFVADYLLLLPRSHPSRFGEAHEGSAGGGYARYRNLTGRQSGIGYAADGGTLLSEAGQAWRMTTGRQRKGIWRSDSEIRRQRFYSLWTVGPARIGS